MITLIREVFAAGARLKRACEEASISFRTYKRWFKAGVVQADKRSSCDRPAPVNKLTPQEQIMILTTCNQAEYAHLPPSQIVPSLLDKEIYYASESSFYRVLKQAGQLNHRGRTSQSQKRHKPTSFKASQANELWSWDITYLASPVKGQYYYLYLFEDIDSRKIVGYEVYEKECGELASQLLQRCMLKEQCFNQSDSLVLHSDNGAPMKSLTLKAKMEELGIISSYSRPRVSNDNPYSESLFKTLKYRGHWPSNGFLSLEDARDWVHHFAVWCNHEHKHSQINYMTSANRHKGLDVEILAARKAVLEEARQAHPLRWSGSVRNCDPVGAVMLNSDVDEEEPLKISG